MQEILYNIPPLQQEESHDCVQTTASLILSHYGVQKSIADIKKEVPVYIDKAGKPLGSSLGHIATYFTTLGFKTTVHTSDIQLFDPSWAQAIASELKEKIKQRAPYIKHVEYDQEAIGVVCDGFIQFLDAGGSIRFPVVDEQYLHSLLQQGPIYAVVQYQALFGTEKNIYNPATKSMERDGVKGTVGTHALTIAGYKDGQFLVIDSARPAAQGTTWIPANRLVAAYYLADINLDSVLITLEPSN